IRKSEKLSPLKTKPPLNRFKRGCFLLSFQNLTLKFEVVQRLPLLVAGLLYFCPLATFFVLLNWWTSYTSVTAIYTTVALFWFKNLLTFFTFVKILTSVCRHCFFFFVSAVGASDC
ncbi:hypothetical protein KSK37_13945, partial [Kaistella sp. DKR-2]|nr:hypothetical protein [Kaistella soli]